MLTIATVLCVYVRAEFESGNAALMQSDVARPLAGQGVERAGEILLGRVLTENISFAQ